MLCATLVTVKEKGRTGRRTSRRDKGKGEGRGARGDQGGVKEKEKDHFNLAHYPSSPLKFLLFLFSRFARTPHLAHLPTPLPLPPLLRGRGYDGL